MQAFLIHGIFKNVYLPLEADSWVGFFYVTWQMSYHVMTSGAKKRMTKKIYFSHNLEIIKNERGHLMKIKTSYLIYAVIGTVFAGLSMFTDIFEKGNFEAIFSNLGMIIGLSISAYILITMAKSFIDLVIKELKN